MARHIDRMVELGLMRKHRRLVRLPWPEGGCGATRVQQTSNAYELLFPPSHVVPKARRVRLNSGCHSGGEESDRRISLGPSLDREESLRVIEQVRLQRTASLMRGWVCRRLEAQGEVKNSADTYAITPGCYHPLSTRSGTDNSFPSAWVLVS